ncbi:hypothetical protein [Turneriella parva]|uniref:Lipoprotein n=1 Tax=Turneriella parva (strain ATCC BAA-1111 / DSM 21527 / NCTC 11395 / H) TaxID=869212 RepID=I4B5J3_TURPD|nr:hypothetical protein [Turneriella parva]AFM12550.1 hypothetical protein Turpa_1903 [Turneriella parva DSM 21527]
MKMQRSIPVLIISSLMLFAACGKKKTETQPGQQARIAYTVYQLGLYEKTDAAKASEWLNRAEMVTVLETVSVPDAKNPAKKVEWAKIERTTGKQGFVDATRLESKAFVVTGNLDIFNVNQVSGKKLTSVPQGHVGFVVEERGDWAKVRFGYKVYEKWDQPKPTLKYVDQQWAQLTGVSYDPVAIGEGVEFEAAARKFFDADAAKKAQGKKDLETIVNDGKSAFATLAKNVLATAIESAPAEAAPAEGAAAP